MIIYSALVLKNLCLKELISIVVVFDVLAVVDVVVAIGNSGLKAILLCSILVVAVVDFALGSKSYLTMITCCC